MPDEPNILAERPSPEPLVVKVVTSKISHFLSYIGTISGALVGLAILLAFQAAFPDRTPAGFWGYVIAWGFVVGLAWLGMILGFIADAVVHIAKGD